MVRFLLFASEDPEVPNRRDPAADFLRLILKVLKSPLMTPFEMPQRDHGFLPELWHRPMTPALPVPLYRFLRSFFVFPSSGAHVFEPFQRSRLHRLPPRHSVFFILFSLRSLRRSGSLPQFFFAGFLPLNAPCVKIFLAGAYPSPFSFMFSGPTLLLARAGLQPYFFFSIALSLF